MKQYSCIYLTCPILITFYFVSTQQVALIAINVLGEYISTENAMQFIQSMNNERTETALASICDDLSFSMYVEESIVERIRELEQKKIKAVNGNSSVLCNFMHTTISAYFVYEFSNYTVWSILISIFCCIF